MGVEVSPEATPGKIDCTIVVKSPSFPDYELRIPARVTVEPLLVTHPNSFFFGFVRCGESARAAITVRGHSPFEITTAKVDRPGTIRVALERGGENAYVVRATLQPSAEPCVVEGNCELATNLEAEPRIVVPYYGHIEPRGPHEDGGRGH